MGFEEGMCAMIEDPDECDAFFEAIADYKIACFNRIIDAYHPDVICYFDDICTQRGPFVSPATYRELIKPHHKRIIDAVHARGVLFEQHMCGFVEPILDDLVEIGVDIWCSAQMLNDIAAITEKYAGRLIVEGGWNFQAPCSFEDSTEQLLNAEMLRCRDEYGRHGNFIITPAIISRQGNIMIIGIATPLCMNLGYNPTVIMFPPICAGSFFFWIMINSITIINKGYGWWEDRDSLKPGFILLVFLSLLMPAICQVTAPLAGIPLRL